MTTTGLLFLGGCASLHHPYALALSQGLRINLERLEGGVEISALIESLRKKGIKDENLLSTMAEAKSPSTVT